MIGAMHRSRLFLKIFFTFVGLTLLATIAIALLAHRWQRGRTFEAQTEHLRQMGQAMALQVRNHQGDREQLADYAIRLSRVGQVGISLIDHEGNVWFDSARGVTVLPPDQIVSHRQRPEIAAALAAGRTTSSRVSTLSEELTEFYAERVDLEGQDPIVVRTAVPMSRGEREIELFGQVLTMTVLAIVLAVIAVTYALARQIVLPLRNLARAAGAIARGDYGQRVFVSTGGELEELAESFNDMSDALEAQQIQLQQGDHEQAAVLEGMVEGVIAVDRRRRIRFANSAAGKLFGFLPPVARDRPLLEVIRNHDLHEGVTQVLTSREPRTLELRWDVGRPRRLSVAITPLAGPTQQGAVIVLHDNTELRRLETIRQEFVANVSHELKTPLSSIMAYTETLLAGAIDDHEHREQFLRRIEEQGRRLSDLIHDMLALARIEAPGHRLEITPIPLAEIAQECVEDQLPHATAKQITLHLAGNLPSVKVLAEEEGLRTILNNLIDNAVKYTPEGGRIEVTWGEADGQVRIEVADTGIGIPTSEQPRVFERFYRVDKARSRQLGSTGLGLSIVKHLVGSFRGSVGVESEVGQGSRFWVKLPVAVGSGQ